MATHRKKIKGILVGSLFLFCTHILVWLTIYVLYHSVPSWLIYGLYLAMLYRVWMWQFFYAIPALIWTGMKGYRWAMSGIAIGIVVTIIINILASLVLGWRIGIGRTY